MKIGVDGRDIGKEYLTGIGRYTLNFLKAMALTKEEMEIVVFLNQKSDIDIKAPNINKKIINEKSTLIWDEIRLPGEIKKEGIGIFYSPYYKVSLFSRYPYIITIHDIIGFRYKYGFMSREIISNIFLKIKYKQIIKRAEKIVTVSNYSKKEIVDEFNIKEERVYVVTQAISDIFYPRNEDEVNMVRNKYSIKKPYLLYVGNYEPHKNVKNLVSAYLILPEEIKRKYSLVIVAKKERRYKNILKLVENEQNVKFIDFITDADLPALYSGAALFVFPSFMEGYGLPPLEAMKCGCPVISSNTASLPEVLGGAVLYFKPDNIVEIADKIGTVINDNAMKEELVSMGLKQAAKYNYRKMKEDIEGLFSVC